MVVRGRRIVFSGGVRAASVHVENGRISRIAAWDDVGDDREIVDAGDHIVMPGLVDTHVHVNDPGRTEWEGFETATRAAAAGGITTILDMPLNSIPATTTVDALETKRRAAKGNCIINVEFIGGVVPGNTHELEPLAAAGVKAFKCFLTPSGVEEFPHVSLRDLREAFPVLLRLGLPLMVHAEDTAHLRVMAGGSHQYADYLACRPPKAEIAAIETMIELMDEWPVRVHVVHLSSAKSLPVIDAARARGLPLTVETCPHYLTFAAEEIPDGHTQFKCAPPIRERAERDDLWKGLIDGQIDLIASDHSPCPPLLKETGGDFFSAWGGISSLQLSLSAVWTGARARSVSPERIADWMSSGPARLAGLKNKGELREGADADITVWDPAASFVVNPLMIQHRHHVTPYTGYELYGRVMGTWVGGRKVF